MMAVELKETKLEITSTTVYMALGFLNKITNIIFKMFWVLFFIVNVEYILRKM